MPSYACDATLCNAAACATDPVTTLSYTITILADHVDEAALTTALEGGLAAYKAATGGDHLCSVGNHPAHFDPVHSPPPGTPPSAPPPPPRNPPSAPPPVLMTACNPATYVFYDDESANPFIPAGTSTFAYNWWPSSRGAIAQPGGQTAEADDLADAKAQCDAHPQCDAFAFHNPPTTSLGNGYGQHDGFGLMVMYKLRQVKGDATLSQWYDSVTWSQPGFYGWAGDDFRFFWAIDECEL